MAKKKTPSSIDEKLITTTSVDDDLLMDNLENFEPENEKETKLEENQEEIFALDEEEPDVIDTEDGGALIRIKNSKDHQKQTEHFANIVDDIDHNILNSSVRDLLEKIELDKNSREDRDKQYEEGIKRTGLGKDAPGGATFDGANKTVHPLLAESCVDFAARVIKEILPPNGPVKSKILGKSNKQKLEKAERKSNYMNYQLTEKMIEFRSELERMATQLPLGGSQYLKLFFNKKLNRIESQFIPIDNIYIPYAASNFYTAERKTHVERITEFEYKKRVEQGIYKELELGYADDIDLSLAEIANNKIEGRKYDSYEEDGLRTFYNVQVYLDLEKKNNFCPYRVVIDKATEKCVAVYRNWDPRDEKKEELNDITEFVFIPWRGAYGIGLIHLIGSLSAAATGTLRILMDSGYMNVIPTLLKLKGGANGQNLNPQPTEVIEMDAGPNADDIRKIAMPIPFNPPSPILMELLGFLVETGKGVVRTSFENLANQNPNAPVGTTLALIEQGMVVFSSIHARMHASMAHLLKVLHRLNSAYLTEEMVLDDIGEPMVDPSDFDGPLDVIPVSDPNIFSETQRFAQIQAIQQRAIALPQLYDLRKVEELFLKQLKIPEGDNLLIPKPEPHDLDPISENVAASVGKPIGALPHQNHLAHIKVHMAFLKSPLFGQNPGIAPAYIPSIVSHLKDHLLMHYMNISTQGINLAEKDNFISGDDEMQQANIAVQVMQAIEQLFDPQFLSDYTQAIEQARQLQPPSPIDPNQLAAQTQQAILAQRQQSDQLRAQGQQAQIQSKEKIDSVKMQQNAALEQLRQDNENMRKQAELETRERINQQDNATAKELAAVEVLSGDKFRVSTGTAIDKNPGA